MAHPLSGARATPTLDPPRILKLADVRWRATVSGATPTLDPPRILKLYVVHEDGVEYGSGHTYTRSAEDTETPGDGDVHFA